MRTWITWFALAAASAACREARPTPTAPAPVDSAGAVVVLDPGTAPHVVLRYPDALAHHVTLTWRGRVANQRPPTSTSTERVERTLHGTLTRTTPGRARVDLLTGTTPALPPQSPIEAMVLRRVPPDLATELPVRLDLTVEPLAFAVDEITERRRHEVDDSYRKALIDALPRVLPTEPIGAGARWQSIVDDPRGTRTTSTWELRTVDGSRLTLVGVTELGPRQEQGWARAWKDTRIDTRTTLDLATFAVIASTERLDRGGGQGATSALGRQAWATLSITPAPRK